MRQRTRKPSLLRKLLDSEAAGGLLLMTSAALALVVANSTLSRHYFAALHASLAGLDILHWINDGLMAIFFLFVGLEIKREFLDGQLASWSNRALPCGGRRRRCSRPDLCGSQRRPSPNLEGMGDSHRHRLRPGRTVFDHHEAAEELALQVGDAVSAIIKSSNVIIGK